MQVIGPKEAGSLLITEKHAVESFEFLLGYLAGEFLSRDNNKEEKKKQQQVYNRYMYM